MLSDGQKERAMSGEGSIRAVAVGRVRAAADRYEFKHQLSKNERLCDFLAYMAKEAPYALVAANLCLRAVEGTSRLTKDDTEETKRVRARASGARLLMIERHKRGLVVDVEGLRSSPRTWG